MCKCYKGRVQSYENMKIIMSMLIATVLSLYTFYSTCWYIPSEIFSLAIPSVFVALFAYFLFIYVSYKRWFRAS